MANLLRWRQRRGRNRFERETLLTAHPHVTYATVVSQIDPYAAPLATGCGELASRKNELGEGALSGFFSRAFAPNLQDRLDDEEGDGDAHHQRRQCIGAVLGPAVVAVVDQQCERLGIARE